jgi:hypothetical protein
VLNVIYTNTVQDQFSAPEIARLNTEVADAERFYFRHSHLNLDLEIVNLVIDRFLSLNQFWLISPPGGYWLPGWSVDGAHSVEQDLYAAGFSDSDFAGVFVWYAWANTSSVYAALGGGTYGVGAILDTAGYSSVPLCWDPETNDWFFLHEFHHQLDSMFEACGYPQYPHPDNPQQYSGHYDDDYSFNAWMVSSWPPQDWAGLVAPWATHPVVTDSDGDLLPDSGSGIPLTETILGGDLRRADTDSDGLLDGDEAQAGLFASSSLTNGDSDTDGVLDSWDAYPLDAASASVLHGTPVLDGVLEPSAWGSAARLLRWPGSSDLAAELYARWDASFLYLGVHVDDDIVATPYPDPWFDDALFLQLDATNDGFAWHGQDNYELWAAPTGAGTTPTFAVAIRMPDGSLNESLVPESTLRGGYVRSANSYSLEVAIPANSATGLNLAANRVLGLQVEIVDFDTNPGWPHSQLFSCFIDFPLLLGPPTGSSVATPGRYRLVQNWPNPFNPSSTLLFEIPQSEQASLRIYDARGRLIRTLIDRHLDAGEHVLIWDGKDDGGRPEPSGTYLYRLETSRHTETRSMVLLR